MEASEVVYACQEGKSGPLKMSDSSYRFTLVRMAVIKRVNKGGRGVEKLEPDCSVRHVKWCD